MTIVGSTEEGAASVLAGGACRCGGGRRSPGVEKSRSATATIATSSKITAKRSIPRTGWLPRWRGWNVVGQRPSGWNPTYGTHTIAYPGSSGGGSPQAMPQGTVGHRRAVSTHRGAGIGDPQGVLPSSPAALRKASDAQRSLGASPRFARLTGELGKPSCGYQMLDFIH